MIYEQRIYDLLSFIDRVIEDNENTQRIEREVRTQTGEEGESHRIDIFAVDRKTAREPGVLREIEATAKLARDEAARLGFDTSMVKPARDRVAGRFFEMQ